MLLSELLFTFSIIALFTKKSTQKLLKCVKIAYQNFLVLFKVNKLPSPSLKKAHKSAKTRTAVYSLCRHLHRRVQIPVLPKLLLCTFKKLLSRSRKIFIRTVMQVITTMFFRKPLLPSDDPYATKIHPLLPTKSSHLTHTENRPLRADGRRFYGKRISTCFPSDIPH